MAAVGTRGSKFVIVFISIAVLIVIVFRFHEYMTKRNFILSVNTVCDPRAESCFVADTESADVAYGFDPYKKVMILASEAPKCLEEHTCENFSCPSNATNCTITYCSEDTLEEGESCLSQK